MAEDKSKLADALTEIGEALRQEARYAVDDIRQKVVEQGWSGQVQTPAHVDITHETRDDSDFWPQAPEVDTRTDAKEMTPDTPSIEPATQEAADDRDFWPQAPDYDTELDTQELSHEPSR